MLVLTRKNQEAVVIGGSDSLEPLLRVTVLESKVGKVRLGFDVDAKVPVHRQEVWERIHTGLPPASRNGHPTAPSNGHSGPSSPKVERSGKVAIITFIGGKIRDVENRIATELEGHTEGLEACHLLLDFTNVEYLGSVELGTLINLHKRINESGGRLTLFNLRPEIYEVFTVTRLQTLLGICR